MTNDHREVEVTEKDTSLAVLEMLSNLAQRIVALERDNELIKRDLGWHEMGPGRIANLRHSVADLKHAVGQLEDKVEEERHESDNWAEEITSRIAKIESRESVNTLARDLAEFIAKEARNNGRG